MSEEDNIGKKIKDRLEGHEFPVSGKVWEHIHKNMPPELPGNSTNPLGKITGSSSSATFITSIVLVSLAAIIAVSVYVSSIINDNNNATNIQVKAKEKRVSIPSNSPQKQAPSSPANIVAEKENTDIIQTRTSPANPVKEVPLTYPATTAETTSDSVDKKQYTTRQTIASNPETKAKDSILIKDIQGQAKQNANIIIAGKSEKPVSVSKEGVKPNTLQQSRKKSVNTQTGKHSANGNKPLISTNIPKQLASKEGEKPVSGTISDKAPQHQKESMQHTHKTAGNDRVLSNGNYSIVSGSIVKEINVKDRTIRHETEIYNSLIRMPASNGKQMKAFKEHLNNNQQPKPDTAGTDSRIIPTKKKKSFIVARFSADALAGTQYTFVSSATDSSRSDTLSRVQAGKPLLSGGFRINYHLPLRDGLSGESRFSFSTGIMVENVQNGYTHTYVQTKTDTSFTPIYEWQYTGTDSIKVVVDSVVQTHVQKQVNSYKANNKLTYAGIPLTISYHWKGSKINFYITAGTQINLLAKRQHTSAASDSTQFIDGAESLQPVYRRIVPLLVGNAGIRYQFTEKLSLLVEPGIKYGLLPIHHSSGLPKQRLASVGLHVGIRYRF